MINMDNVNDRILKETLDYILKSNSYYTYTVGVNNGNLNEFPLLTRAELQKNGKSIISDLYKSKINELFTTSSSGSTGMPVVVYWDHAHYLISMRTLWKRRSKYYGITPLSKKLEFTLLTDIIKSPGPQYRIDKNNTVLSFKSSSLNSLSSITEAWHMVEKFEPEWIYVQPSVLKRILYVIEKEQLNIPSSIRYIECVGEILFDDLREQTLNVFRYSVVANMYGSEEMNGIAIECPYHNMHVISENVHVECCIAGKCCDDGVGEIVITQLCNRAQPLVRYLQGDVVEMTSPIQCRCGYNDKIIKRIYGRVRESVLIEPDNLELNNLVLFDCIRLANKKLNNLVLKYKFYYYKSQNKLYGITYVNDKSCWLENEVTEFIRNFFYAKGYHSCVIEIVVKDASVKDITTHDCNKHMSFEIRD